jgi:ADP-ribosylglycohydrolase
MADRQPVGLTLSDRAVGVLLALAAGDAMGWMTEFVRSPEDLKRKMGVEEISGFHEWSKQVGGRFQGYTDRVLPGDYSDDTQLTISTAACIGSDGRFDYQTFCEKEFPFWLEYARGAGGTIKEAARKIQRRSASWNSNFFHRKIKGKTVDYRDGGANGAAMRIAPHVLANVGRWSQAEADIWRNTIISHGHPRAILGALLYGYALHDVIHLSSPPDGREVVARLGQAVKVMEIPNLQGLHRWLDEWNEGSPVSFKTVFEQTVQEAVALLRVVWLALQQQTESTQVLKQLGCFEPNTRGSGLATVIAGLYLFARAPTETAENIVLATNMIGSDTDSIAAFTGGLGGALQGREAVPEDWRAVLQDAEFLERLGRYLADSAWRNESNWKPRREVPATNLGTPAVRSRLHEYQRLIHIWLGPGIVAHVETQGLLTKSRTATIARIDFDAGQSCVFAFRTDEADVTLFETSE